MKNEMQYAKSLAATLRRIRGAAKSEPPPQRDPVAQLVVGFLEWNATTALALAAQERLFTEMVDTNELRVSLPEEVAAILGPDYPQAEDRAARMLESLHDIYVREHDVSLESLQGKPKKQVRQYLDTLGGMPCYVAAQVTLLNFAGHAVPVDDRIRQLLEAEGCVEAGASCEEVGAFLERQVKAGEGVDVYLALRTWADGVPLGAAPAAAVAATPRKGGSKTKPARTPRTAKVAKTNRKSS